MDANSVSVFAVALDAAPCDEGILSRDELERAERFVFARDRRRFVVARAALRRVLSRVVAVPEQALKFGYGPYGKPRLDYPAGGPEFNVSHSEDRALIALSTASEIGVDLEAVLPFAELDSVAKEVFSPQELDRFSAIIDPSERSALFFRYWSRKESVLKALGTGFSRPAATVNQAGPDLIIDGCDVSGCFSLLDLDVGPGFAAALAVKTANFAAPVSVHDFY